MDAGAKLDQASDTFLIQTLARGQELFDHPDPNEKPFADAMQNVVVAAWHLRSAVEKFIFR